MTTRTKSYLTNKLLVIAVGAILGSTVIEATELVDANRLNNRRVTEGGNTFARKQHLKVVVWAQQLFYLMGSLF